MLGDGSDVGADDMIMIVTRMPSAGLQRR